MEIPSGVLLDTIRVDLTVDLDRESKGWAIEVDDVSGDGVLTSKPKARHLAAADGVPKDLLSGRRLAPERSRLEHFR
jgi:hypothetical protein